MKRPEIHSLLCTGDRPPADKDSFYRGRAGALATPLPVVATCIAAYPVN